MKKYLGLALILLLNMQLIAGGFFSTTKQQDERQHNTKAEIVNNDFLTENALHDAVRAGDLTLTKFLLKKGANINLADQYGFTPLHLAVRLHDTKIVKYLIGKGANVNTRDAYKDTPLLDSTRNDDTDISKILICNGAHRNVVDAHQMSTLNNSSKNKNELITKLLTADSVAPYCQSEIDININIADGEKICGDILKGYISSIKVNLTNKEEETLGDFDAQIDNDKKQWCIKTKQNDIKPGTYTISATATDESENSANAVLDATIEELNATYEISIDDKDDSMNNKPKLCGKILQSNMDSINVALQSVNGQNFGPYMATIDRDKKTWCTNVSDTLPNDKYTATAYGYKKDREVAQSSTSFNIFMIAGLYDSLDNEFKDDYEKWSASLNKDTLTFSFAKPSVLFKSGSTYLQTKFKHILDDFFPRYVKILLKHKEDIKNIMIEGHSSSEYGLGKDDEEKYQFNLKLSQGRADEVLKYASNIPNDTNVDNIMWIVTTFKAQGMSSSQLVLNEDGTENKVKSRRVDFTIKTKKGDSL